MKTEPASNADLCMFVHVCACVHMCLYVCMCQYTCSYMCEMCAWVCGC